MQDTCIFCHARQLHYLPCKFIYDQQTYLDKAWFLLVAATVAEGKVAANNWDIFYFYCNGLHSCWLQQIHS